MIVSINTEVTDNEKFRLLPLTTRYLYNEIVKHRDWRGAISEEQLKNLVIVSSASKNDVLELLKEGYILYNDIDEKFYIDAYFHVHNKNLPKYMQHSNFSKLIDKYFVENPYTHILTNKVKVTTSTEVYHNLIQSNLMQSQYVNINTSEKCVNTESVPPDTLRQSQYLYTEHEVINTESALGLFRSEFCENDILTCFEKLKNLQKKRKMECQEPIRNEVNYLKSMLKNAKKQKKVVVLSSKNKLDESIFQKFKEEYEGGITDG